MSLVCAACTREIRHDAAPKPPRTSSIMVLGSEHSAAHRGKPNQPAETASYLIPAEVPGHGAMRGTPRSSGT
jgi:hypothetical protein